MTIATSSSNFIMSYIYQQLGVIIFWDFIRDLESWIDSNGDRVSQLISK